MFDAQKRRQTGANVFASSVEGIANITAIITTFLATPLVYDQSTDWVTAYTQNHYGYEVAELASFVWGILLSVLIFFLSRATIATAITVGGFAIGARIF